MTLRHLRGGVALVGTASDFATANPVLLDRQLSRELDTGVEKLGDGTTHYNSLTALPGGGGGGGVVGLGDNLALYSNSETVAAGGGSTLTIGNEEFAPTGSTFSHDGSGVITVTAACVVAVDVMIDFADAADSTFRNGWIKFNGGALTTEGGAATIPAVNGGHTQLTLHNTVPVPAGTTITVRAQHGAAGDVAVTAEIEVTCLGHTA